ncbi:rifin PIR protein, putative [Plasmodium reichenowi]|uniref:Rifin PIR protein, putative n=1 Tax=Plasmodium reichenowi TaxID=5854 RepID=A0A2P9D451_PLARE|nr:rifin PIR protein, putative [Plasmodium reichenowi]
MKLHYTKILLFFFALNILVTSYHVNTHKKPFIIPRHTLRYTSRVLSEGDTQSSGYDKDEEMKSVMQQFEDRTSQRFEEYEKRMKAKRQKRKEERDKNIEEIIKKDKMEKLLAEKIEKGCLRCGCGLGGVAASVGLFGGLGVYGWKTAAIATAAKEAGAEAGVKALIKELGDELGIQNLFDSTFAKDITPNNYFCETLIFNKIKIFYKSLSEEELTLQNYSMFYTYKSMSEDQRTQLFVQHAKSSVEEAVKEATKVTTEFTSTEMATVQSDELEKIATASYNSYSAIGYSVLAILIIVMVMIIIYLVLRYRRKKKMKKKAQYTKLLNQ